MKNTMEIDGYKRLAGVSAAGRPLKKPVLHYTLAWPKDERPDRAEMNRAAEETLKALGLERHQALIVAHNDKTHPHVHLVVNRVDPETGKAAKLGNDRLKLANWAERWERDRGGLRCPERVTNRKKREANKKRGVRKYVKDWKSLHTARHRRERMHPPQVQRRLAPNVLLKTPAHRQRWAETGSGPRGPSYRRTGPVSDRRPPTSTATNGGSTSRASAATRPRSRHWRSAASRIVFGLPGSPRFLRPVAFPKPLRTGVQRRLGGSRNVPEGPETSTR